MRSCEGCGKPDAPVYDFKQGCTCGNERLDGVDKHAPACKRIRHSVTPYLAELRKVTKFDKFNEGQLLPAEGKPDEFARLKRNGFRIKAINGYIYAERTICANCIRVWAEREENRKHFEKAKAGKAPKSYYDMLCQ